MFEGKHQKEGVHFLFDDAVGLMPDSIALTRVNFAARSEYEMINNYKLLQSAFDKVFRNRGVGLASLGAFLQR